MASKSDTQTPSVQPKTEAVQAPSQPEFTKCFLVQNPTIGAARIFADDAESAVAAFVAAKVPGVTVESVRAGTTVAEIPFTPAATEVNKPCGWPRRSKNKLA